MAAVNGGVCIRVEDQGVGIPATEQQQIFEKFYRGRGELAKQVKGAGLGLSPYATSFRRTRVGLLSKAQKVRAARSQFI